MKITNASMRTTSNGAEPWLERVMEPEVVEVVFIPGHSIDDETLDRLHAWLTEEPSQRGESPEQN